MERSGRLPHDVRIKSFRRANLTDCAAGPHDVPVIPSPTHFESGIFIVNPPLQPTLTEILRMLSLHPEEGAEVLFIADGVDEVQAVESACALIKDYAENEKREKAEREARKAKRKEMLLRFLPFLRK